MRNEFRSFFSVCDGKLNVIGVATKKVLFWPYFGLSETGQNMLFVAAVLFIFIS